MDTPRFKPILADAFRHDGRGPILSAAYFGAGPLSLIAVDCQVPETDAGDEQEIYLEFHGLQAFTVTPEEVGNDAWHCLLGDDQRSYAAFELLESPWLASLDQTHLRRCHHFVFVFYDDYLDVICESVEAFPGSYRECTVV